MLGWRGTYLDLDVVDADVHVDGKGRPVGLACSRGHKRALFEDLMGASKPTHT